MTGSSAIFTENNGSFLILIEMILRPDAGMVERRLLGKNYRSNLSLG